MMATSTILRELRIKDKAKVRSFVHALDKAQSIKCKEVKYTRTFENVKAESICEMFGIKK